MKDETGSQLQRLLILVKAFTIAQGSSTSCFRANYLSIHELHARRFVNEMVNAETVLNVIF
jgi:hypothetical protein